MNGTSGDYEEWLPEDNDNGPFASLEPGDLVLVDGPGFREYGLVMDAGEREVTIVTDGAVLDDEQDEQA